MVYDIWQRINMGGSMSKFYISLQIDSRKFMTSNEATCLERASLVCFWQSWGRTLRRRAVALLCICHQRLWTKSRNLATSGSRDGSSSHLLTVLTLMDEEMEEMKVFRLKFSEHSRHSRDSTTCALNFSRYSFASDVWSYGVTIYEAAMLVPPFRGANICQAGIKVDQSLSKSLHTTVSWSKRIMSKNSRSMTLQFIAVRS